MRTIFFHISFLLSLLIYFECSGQQPELKNIIQYTQLQGLSSYNIHKIIKDKNGFLWIATQDGLNRFEGKEFVIYNKGLQAKRELFSSDIRDLVYDSLQNIIWVICNQGGINAIDITTGQVIYSIPYNNKNLQAAWRICARQSGDYIYIGTSGGIEIFNCKLRRFENIAAPTNEFFRTNNILDIRIMDVDKNGNLWMGVMNRGIIIIDPVKKIILRQIADSVFLPGKRNEIFWPLSGTFSPGNLYWMGTKAGLKIIQYDEQYNLTLVKSGNLLSQFAGEEINALFFNNDKELLISGSNLYKYNIVTRKFIRIIPDKIEAEPWLQNITYCYEDDKQNLWLGCRQGLILVKKNEPFIFGRQTNTLSGFELGHIYAVCVINEEKILAGTKNGLYEVGKDNHIKLLAGKGLIQNIFRLTADDIIISGSNITQLYTPKGIIPLALKYPEFNMYENWHYNSAVTLNDSVIIIGTESGQGVLIWNKKARNIKRLQQNNARPGPGLASNTVNVLFYQKNLKAAILSDYSITIADNDLNTTRSIQLKKKADGKALGIFMDMAETEDNFWLAAYGEGLIKLDKNYNVIKIFGTKDGLSNNGVYKLFNYKDSILIITTNNGLSVFETGSNKFILFYENDGLHNNAFEEASGDTYQDKFFAGGVNGFTIIDPSKFTRNRLAPQLFINRILVQSNTAVTDTGNLELKKIIIPENILQTTLYFSAVNWNNPQRTSFAWRITEQTHAWSNLGGLNFINLVGLEHGTYHFQVKASNEDGVWSEPKEVLLIYLPRWYQTWWFKIALVLITAGIIYAFYRYRISQIKKQHEIRKNIATDLHDDLGSTLNSVKVFTNLAISGVKQAESLQQVKQNLQEATMGLRDMIWVLDDSLDTVDELVTRLKQYALPVARASNIEANIKADNDINNRQLTKEEKRNLFLLCKEAINNSIKYSGAHCIDINITGIGKKIKIVVADNGTGFNADEVKKGYGLKNMHYRAGQIKYKISLVSSPGNGTHITIQPV